MANFALDAATEPLLADGAVGAYLASQGKTRPPVEALNFSDPPRVENAHREYQEAGAVMLRTNTRLANPASLAPFGLVERCEAINNSASAILRAVIGPEGVAMGSVAPVEPRGARPLPAAERERAYSEQLIYLSDTGVNFFLLEHFTHLDEALLVVRLAKRCSDAPVLAQLTFSPAGSSADGQSTRQCADELLRAGADALGISCAPGGAPGRKIAAVLHSYGVPVSVMPGAAQIVTDEAAESGRGREADGNFGRALADLAAPGVTILGGCCGVTPAHIASAASHLGR